MTTPAASLYTEPAPAAKPASAWEDLVDVFTQPRQVFERRRDGRFWLALVVFTLLMGGAFFVGRPVIQPALDRQMSAQIAKIQADPNVPAAQKEAIASRMRSVGDSPWATAGGVAFMPIMLFVVALTLWLVAKLFGSGATLGQAMAVTAIGGIPRAVLSLLVAAVSAALGRQSQTMQGLLASPAAFLGADASPMLAAFLGRLDLGVLWHTALLGLGIAVMGRLVRRSEGPALEGAIPVGRGMAAAGVVWALGTLVTVYQAFTAGAA